MPTETLSRLSEIPARARAAGSIATCVIVAGCAIRLSTPPSDSASENSLRLSTSARTPGRPLASSKLSMAPGERCWAAAIEWPG